jgi:hypothetical protein
MAVLQPLIESRVDGLTRLVLPEEMQKRLRTRDIAENANL